MISTYLEHVSAHADKTLHWKISGNINDIDTFLHIFSLETYSSGKDRARIHARIRARIRGRIIREFRARI